MSKKFILVCASILVLFLFSCSVADMSGNQDVNLDYESYPLGALEETPESVAEVGEYRSLTRSETLPTSVDLSVGMPPVKSQGSQGSCVGWATGYALKSFEEKLEEGWDLSGTDNQFSPAWVYNQINFGYDSGAFVSDALDLIVESGCDTWENFPYDVNDCLTQPDAASMARAASYKAISWQYIARDVEEVKQVLADGQAVSFRTDIYQDFYNISESDPVYDVVDGTRKGGHAMCLVGYDDDLQAFKFINSWGGNWGLNGFGYISYDFCVENSPVGFRAYLLEDGPNGDATTKTVHYYSENSEANIHYQKDDGSWSTAPGVAMTAEGSNWFVAEVDDTGEMQFCFNDNNGNWDSRNMQDYATTLTECWIKEEVIYSEKPVDKTYTATFTFNSQESGNGIQYVSINVRKDGESSYIFNGSSDANGLITIPDLANDTYVIEAYSADYLFSNNSNSYSWNFTVSDSDYTSQVDLTFKGASVGVYFYIPGGIPTPGSPLPGLDVTIQKDGSYYDTQPIGTAEHGQPWMGINKLYSGTYTFTLDQVKDGKRYTGEISATVNEANRWEDASMTVTEEDWDGSAKIIHYYNDSYSQAYMHYQQDSGSWTTSPGVAMSADGSNWFSVEIEDEDNLTFCFNNGSGEWDSNGGSNYSTDLDEVWVKDGNVYDTEPTNTVVFTVQYDRPSGYTIQIRGSQSPLSWSTGQSLYAVDGDTFYWSENFDSSFEYKYTLTDSEGNVYWEDLASGGNRTGAPGNQYTDYPVFNL